MNGTVLVGPRLALRRLVDSDLDFLAEMLGDSEVMRYWPRPLDRAGAEQWLRRQRKRYAEEGCGYWLIVDRETNQPVGQAGVLMTEVDGRKIPALGYMIHRPFQRRGHGLDAARMCVRYVFESLRREAAYTLVRPENEPSMALARRLGMKPLRTVEHEGFTHVLLQIARPEP